MQFKSTKAIGFYLFYKKRDTTGTVKQQLVQNRNKGHENVNCWHKND